MDDRKSTSGGALFLGKILVLGIRKKHNCISQSTTKDEYVAIVVNYSNIVWTKKLLKGMKDEITKPIVIFYDSTSTIDISKNPIMHTKTKHIAIKYHYLRELVQDKEVRLEYVNTKDKIGSLCELHG